MEQIKREESVARDLGEFDAVICGGGLSGWAAAVSLARQERSVLLAANRTSLGHEISGAMSTWWPDCLEVPSLWQDILDELEDANAARGTMVDPVATQVALERAAEQAGVELLFQVNFHPGEGELTLLTGRWGLMATRSGIVVDASERGHFAIESGAKTRDRRSDEPVLRRALMVKTGLNEPERIGVGEGLPIADASVMAWTGFWPGDVIIEAELDLPADDMTSLEVASRRAMIEIVSRLRESREDLAQGSLVAVALDPILRRETVLAATGDDTAACSLHGGEGEVMVTRGMMLPEGTADVIAASPALDLGEITARECYHAPNAVLLGEAAGKLAGEMLRDAEEAS